MIWRLALIALVACSSHASDAPKPDRAGVAAPQADAAAPMPVTEATTEATTEAATEVTAQAAYDAKHWDVCAERFLIIAKTSADAQKALALDSAACCYARGGKPDLAFSTMDLAVAAGLRSV